MEITVPFLFRDKLFTARLFIDISEQPCYLFIFLSDPALIEEFGDEISIKTDGELILPMKLNYPALAKLRKALFASIRYIQPFLDVKETMRIL
jgi:hypothetical protein